MTELTHEIEGRLLHLLQARFPLSRRPYRDLASQIGTSEGEILDLVANMKASGLVRQISPVFDARSLGYTTTLVASRMPGEHLDRAARRLLEHPGISHAYERDHHLNIWFTLALPSRQDAEAELQPFMSEVGAEVLFCLPALRIFKLRTHFAREAYVQQVSRPEETGGRDCHLSDPDRKVVNETQEDLPLIPEPFATMAARTGLDQDSFLETCRSLLGRRVMRRFGAAVNHRRAGFNANAMASWAIRPEEVETAGRALASLSQVSHCYERKTNTLWPHNLFAMVHGQAKEDCLNLIRRVTAENGLTEPVVLFSTRELKKIRVKYLV